MRLKDRVAIITGGGFGIGKAIALAFAKEEAKIVIASRNLSNLEDVVNQIKGEGGQATAIQMDICDEKQIQSMVAQTLDKYGQIDILVNNSGIAGPTANVVDVALEDWNKTFAVNLTGMMLCTREALKSMIPRKSGNIINIASSAMITGFRMRSPYCASKWGVIGLTLTTATEAGIHNIRVNCVSPGPVAGPRIDSVFSAKAEAAGLTYEDIYRAAVSNMALQRLVTAEEVAAAVVFLASDESSGTTGHVLHVNGGMALNIF